MKNAFNTPKTALLVIISVMTSLLIGCRSDAEQSQELIENQWNDQSNKLIINHGRVVIKREPHGSVRAKVFQGQLPAYEFILDRQKQQDLLTKDIDNADVYLTGEHRDGLIIDDRQTGKRYVLAFHDIGNRLKELPAIPGQTVFIEGYSMALIPLQPSIALNLR